MPDDRVKNVRTAIEDQQEATTGALDKADKIVDQMDNRVSAGDSVSGEEVDQLRQALAAARTAAVSNKAAGALGDLEKPTPTTPTGG